MKSFKRMWLLLLALSLTACQPIRAPAAPSAEGGSADIRIANAESAGIRAIAQDATILGWDKDGMPTVVLRKGGNDWVCLTDWPVSPGNDPACYDAVFMAWNEALMAGKEEPALKGTGIGYMLASGSDPSNTDPFAMEPVAGKEWISTPQTSFHNALRCDRSARANSRKSVRIERS